MIDSPTKLEIMISKSPDGLLKIKNVAFGLTCDAISGTYLNDILCPKRTLKGLSDAV